MTKKAKSHPGSVKGKGTKPSLGKTTKRKPAVIALQAAKKTPPATPEPTVDKAKEAVVQAKARPNKGGFGRPPMRRGRRPKALAEYQPQNQEEDYNQEFDYRGLEYDTGIRVNSAKDDGAGGLDRFEEFDEELNFDY